MILRDVYERFAKKAPVSVMVRATIENVLSADRLNAIFQKNAQRQVVSDLMFSTVADIMGLVVCQIQPSVNAAYRDREGEIGVTIKAVYDKLQGIDPIQVGQTGTVVRVHRVEDDPVWHQIDVAWDNGRRLMVVSPPDRFEIVDDDLA